ncbi:TipC family immunity protein [Enterococcus ureilyticus]|uniref:TipC family immunity protein n=1 Tax=Enterococcus ureilyticus TaxID=1131292 RepID=UPI001A91EE87|nr:TipC family immunity protein [Enterococcus ureilyticus]MBO0445631.1 TipC family immunity protein [Enterococcus ureilyticus]
MKKKPKLVVLCIVISFIGYKGLEYLKIKNVFDEMYYTEIKDMKKQTANGFPKMKQIKSWDRKKVQTFDDLTIINEQYKKEFLKQDENLTFHFGYTDKILSFVYTKKIDNGIFLQMGYSYFVKEKLLKEKVNVTLSGVDELDPTNNKEIEKYLDKYQISKDFLKDKSNEILYNTVIKNWVESYDSSYTVTDIGEVTIERDQLLK